MRFLKTIRELINVVTLFEKISYPHLRSIGLTTGQFDVIATLGNQPPMTCKELAENTLMLKGNLTVVLNGLLKKELINRRENPDDRRSVLIALTTTGEELFQKSFPEHKQYLEPICSQFDNTEMDQLQQELYAIRMKLEKYLNSNLTEGNHHE